MMTDITAQAQQYYLLVQKGTPPAEAFKQAFPNGVPTALDRVKAQAKENQKQGYGQLAGALGGLAGTRYLMDKVPAFFSSGGAEVAAPEIISATRTGGAAVSGGSATGGGFAGGGAATQAGAPTVLGNAGSMGVAPLAAIAGATYLGSEAAYDMAKGRKPGTPGRVVLGMATGGLSEAFNALNRKTTKDFQKERWNEVAGSNDAATQNYGKQYQDYLGSEQQGIDAQYPNTFDGKKEAGTLGAEDVWGGYGMFKTYGNDWLNKYSEDDRRNISQALIDNDLITSNKGDIVVRDENRARELASQVLGGQAQTAAQVMPNMASLTPEQSAAVMQRFPGITNAVSGGQGSPLVQALQPQRSNTRSPGIGKDGKRIAY